MDNKKYVIVSEYPIKMSDIIADCGELCVPYRKNEPLTSILNKICAVASGGYTLPKASSTVLGGIKVGQHLSIESDGTLNVTQSESDPIWLAQKSNYYTKLQVDALLSAIVTVESDPLFTAWLATPPDLSEFNDDVGYLTAETDPIWTADKPDYLTIISAAATYQPLDGDLTAVATLSGTGLARRTGANTWSLDTNTYLTAETDPVFTAWLGTYTTPTLDDVTTAGNTTTNTIQSTSFRVRHSLNASWWMTIQNTNTSGNAGILDMPHIGSNTRFIPVSVNGNFADAGGDITVSTAESDPVFTAWLAGPPDLSEFNDDVGYLTAESDPVWLADKPSYLTSAAAAAAYQPLDADLTAIAALGFTSTAFLTKTAANTWVLDTNTYITGTPSALTKVDDTNVTLTLGGTPATALLQATSLTLGWTGTLAVSRGGTGEGSASITAFNNITGYTAAGATGTTSTNLVFSTSPTIATPTITTSATIPIVIGSTSANGTLTLEGNNTTGNTAANTNISFKVGDSASTTAAVMLNNGSTIFGGVTSLIGTEVVSIQNNQNAATRLTISNSSATAASQCAIYLQTSGSVGFDINHYSASFTSSGSAVAGSTRLQSNGSAGLSIGTGNSAPLLFRIGAAEKWRVDVNGSFTNTAATGNTSALLQVDSTTKGFLPPRMTNAQRTAISSPAVGLIVYCTDATEGLYINKSGGWTFII